MTFLEQRKRHLLAESEAYRHLLSNELQDVKTAITWVPKAARIARTVYPFLVLSVPIIGFFFAKKRPVRSQAQAPARKGVIASALAGYRFFRQIKPVLDGLRRNKN